MAENIEMPKLGFDMAEGTLVRWVKAEGEQVTKGDVLAEIETDKATVEVQSFSTGILLRQLVESGTSVPVGQPIAVLGQPGEKIDSPVGKKETATENIKVIPVEAEKKQGSAPSGESDTPGEFIKASPLAKRMAVEHDLDLGTIEGTGPKGRIVKADIVQAVAEMANTPTIPEQVPFPTKEPKPVKVPTSVLPEPVWGASEVKQDTVLEISKLRSIIAKRMTESKQNFPHFYVTHTYDVEELVRLRQEINELLPEDQKISLNDYIVKAIALTLREFPNLNASIKENTIVQHGRLNIGIAVAVENGLLTIVCKDADRKPLRLISSEIRDMVARARSGKVRPEDIEGSTFSISNMGMYDVDHFIAIINPPEAAILAVGSAQKIPVVVGNELKIGTRMKATVSADHRVSDGAEAAQFLQKLAVFLEKPKLLLI